jgi:hypothetical protein
MPRLHLFEFEDQKWFPNVIREGMMDYLRHMIGWMQFYKPAAPLIKNFLIETKNNQIIELCAGAGGGVIRMKGYLNELNCHPKIILTDLYPNLKAYESLKKIAPEQIDFITHSVNALNPAIEDKGVLMFFSSFHHFKPEQAKQILMNAAITKTPIAIFDSGTTGWMNIFAVVFLQPFSFVFLTPFFTPFSWSRLFFTYIIPLIPICTIWDGSVSVLRFYSIKEMKMLTECAEAKNYKWEIGMKKNPLKIPVNYILGFPTSK